MRNPITDRAREAAPPKPPPWREQHPLAGPLPARHSPGSPGRQRPR